MSAFLLNVNHECDNRAFVLRDTLQEPSVNPLGSVAVSHSGSLERSELLDRFRFVLSQLILIDARLS